MNIIRTRQSRLVFRITQITIAFEGSVLIMGRHIVVGAMHEASFFQKQIERCNLLAEQASSQTEQDFWLRSAGRWEAILRVKTAKRPTAKPSTLSGDLPSRLASSDDQGLTAIS